VRVEAAEQLGKLVSVRHSGVEGFEGVGFFAEDEAFVEVVLYGRDVVEAHAAAGVSASPRESLLIFALPLSLNDEEGFEVGRDVELFAEGVEDFSGGFGVVASAVCAFE